MLRAQSNRDKKHNAKVKVECVMRNKWIDGLTINHSLAPLLEQERMRTLDAKKVESSSKINLKDVSWWMSIKDAYRPRALMTTRLSKERYISLVT
jgi:type IV secretory pathway TraG/TraD family ATPase VirD4